MSSSLDTRRLQLLAQVVRSGSFSKAAETLGISQPALSKSIRSLEKSLDVQLLERGRFGARPTEFALSLMRHADAIDAELSSAQAEILALRSAKSGALHIGCGPTEATRLLPLALTKLRKSSPDIQLTVSYGLNETLMPMVRSGEVDCALSSIPAVSKDQDLKQVPLHRDQGVVVSRSHHPLARQRKPVTVEQLAQLDWVLARQSELERRAFDDVFIYAGLTPPRPIIETTSTTLMKSMVMQGDVLTFVPRELVYWESRAKQLKVLSVPFLTWERTVGMTTRARGSQSPVKEALLTSLRSAVSSLLR